MDTPLTNEQHWQMTSAIGKFVLPIMKTLNDKMPNMLGAVLCTADGFNICSIGLEEVNVGKMASLSSSMFSIGNAVIDTLSENMDSLSESKEQKKELLLTIDSFQVVIVEVKHGRSDNLVLLVAVDQTATGIVFMTIRKVVNMLEDKLNNRVQAKKNISDNV